jgi:mono/diheme cytochrome c family protein
MTVPRERASSDPRGVGRALAIPMVSGLLVLSVLCAVALADDPPAEGLANAAYTEAQATRGEAGYMEHCAACHRDDLTGLGPAPELAGDAFLGRWEQRSVDELLAKVRTTMPQSAPGSLSEAQYLDIVAFLLAANGLPAGSVELTAEPQ